MLKKAGILAVALIFLAGIISSGDDTSEVLHVAAASSLRFAFEEIGEAFYEQEGTEVMFQFGASGNLAQQIANGASVDLYASADRRFIHQLVEHGKMEKESVTTFSRGILVLAFHQDYGVPVERIEDLEMGSVQRIAMANPEHAPYGKAAKEALMASGIWDSLEDKIVYGSTVLQAMQYIETGNVSAGMISKSVARSEEMAYIPIDQNLYEPLAHFIGIVADSDQKEKARRFTAFLQQKEAVKIMEKYGFDLP